MSISAPFIRRPVATSLLAMAITLAGILAFNELPVAPLPRVDFPTVQVSAQLPGASPETMASSVATPLERRFGRIAGLTEMTSTSSLGSTSITLQFDLNRDVDAAARDVQAAIAAAASELPPNLPLRPVYRKVNPADSPIMILSLTSDALPLSQVFESANTVLAQKISQVKGVGQVFVGGGQQPAVRVQVDPEALAGMGLGLEDVRNLLATATVDQPKGQLQGPKAAQWIGANDQLFGADAYKGLILAYKNGAAVRLSDVANVFDDVENERVAAWTNGERSVLVIIRRQPAANIIDTVDRVRALIPILASSISPAIKIEVALDRTQTIRASVRDVEITLGISVLLVTLVVFVFLRTLRATAIPSVAVPLSLLGTFGVMYLLGYSIDNLSLMALTISTGFVVDDAIVVTENITRFIEEGRPPLEAALEGARQIGFTIVSITVSLIAVFIPILLMGGVVGRLFREFAMTLGIAVAISAFVSLTLTPMMCGRLLRHRREEEGRLGRFAERVFDGLLHAYGAGLKWVLQNQGFMQLVTLGTVGVTIALYVLVPKGLFPQQDNGMLVGFSDAPQDISFAAMKERQQMLNAVLSADPDIGHANAFIGGGFNARAANTGTCFIELKSKPARKASADQIIARLRPKLAKIDGISLYLQSAQDVNVGGRSSRTQFQYALEDADLDELKTWAPKVMARLAKLREIKDIATDQQTAGLELDLAIDRDTASRMGITPQAVDDTLYDAYGQRQVATTFTEINQYRVVLEVKPQAMQSPDSLDRLYVASAAGGQVPLRSFTSLSTSSTPLSISHQGQFPAVTLSFNLAPGVALGDAVEAIHRAEADIGKPASVHASFQGTAQVFQQSLASEPLLILAALVTVYIVLGMLYESYVHPITILSTLPSAGIGALLALLLFKVDFSIIGLIGIILLIGIVKKNAILMIDFAIEAEKTRDVTPEQAIYEACMLRFRPILMTTLAALLGGLPLAVVSGTGSELRQPLGITIVGGLIISQMLTLFTTPVVYLLLDRITKRNRERVVSLRSASRPA